MSVFIKNIGDAKRKLSKVIRQYERDELTTDKFRSLVYGISKYIEAVYKYEVESKVLELESKVDERIK